MERIQLDNTIFEGSNAIYLLGDGQHGPTTLVDTGVAFPAVEKQLREGLAGHGVDIEDIDQILLTHYHQDHAGLAGSLQAESDAIVRIHRGDAPIVAREPEAVTSQSDRISQVLRTWGIPADERTALEAHLNEKDTWSGETATVTEFEDGAVFEAAEQELEAVHLPGHSRGLAGFYDRDRDWLYAGDALLPKYTPNVGGADVRVVRPLAKYIDSLERIVDLAPDLVLPGHRGPIEAPVERAHEIIAHHRDRTRAVISVLREHGPADAWTVSAHLFGDLEGIHVLHGPGEAAAHLDHLVDAGVVDCDDGVYELGSRVDVDAVLPGAA